MRRFAGVGLMLLAGGGISPVAAHHGWSSYDSTKELTLAGTIKEAGYEHPHGHVRLEVPGKVWSVVLAPPTRMERRRARRSVVAGIARQEHAAPVPLDDDARKNGRHLAPLQSLERGGGRGGAVEELQVLHRRITQRQLAPGA